MADASTAVVALRHRALRRRAGGVFARASFAFSCALPAVAGAAEPIALTRDSYRPDLGVLIIQVNWGRTWKCGGYENAQLQALAFTRLPLDAPRTVSIELAPPSKLFVDDRYLPYADVVEPGEYALTRFDVKVARSASDVGHLTGSMQTLVKDGEPIGGRFTVNAGEIVYVGHFGLDCAAEPLLWRQYIRDRKDFERYVGGFRASFPFVKQVPVEYRLFSTALFGKDFSLPNPTVE